MDALLSRADSSSSFNTHIHSPRKKSPFMSFRDKITPSSAGASSSAALRKASSPLANTPRYFDRYPRRQPDDDCDDDSIDYRRNSVITGGNGPVNFPSYDDDSEADRDSEYQYLPGDQRTPTRAQTRSGPDKPLPRIPVPTLRYSDPDIDSTSIYADSTSIYADSPSIYADSASIYADSSSIYADSASIYGKPAYKPAAYSVPLDTLSFAMPREHHTHETIAIEHFPVAKAVSVVGVAAMDAMVDGMNGMDAVSYFAHGKSAERDRRFAERQGRFTSGRIPNYHPLREPPLPTPPPGV
ncbi:hypothetical protein FIBSPDRAFT_944419, partial [Athelia psychrophila]